MTTSCDSREHSQQCPRNSCRARIVVCELHMLTSMAAQEFSRGFALSECPESRPDVRVHMADNRTQAGPFKTTSPNRSTPAAPGRGRSRSSFVHRAAADRHWDELVIPISKLAPGKLLASVNSFEPERRGAMHAVKFKQRGGGRLHLAVMPPPWYLSQNLAAHNVVGDQCSDGTPVDLEHIGKRALSLSD